MENLPGTILLDFNTYQTQNLYKYWIELSWWGNGRVGKEYPFLHLYMGNSQSTQVICDVKIFRIRLVSENSSIGDWPC